VAGGVVTDVIIITRQFGFERASTCINLSNNNLDSLIHQFPTTMSKKADEEEEK